MTNTGCVSRWFNRKGYGFINVISSDSENVGQDIFVHLSGINISGDCYKSLYPGEYVSFDLDKSDDGRFTCVNLTGIGGGPLLVEHPDYRYRCIRKDHDSGGKRGAAADATDATNATDATDATEATDAATEGAVSDSKEASAQE